MSLSRKQPKIRSGPGPFSRESTLANIDRRTKPGRVLRGVERDLVEHLGGSPSAPQMLIIRAAAVKATRLWLLSESLLAGADISSDNNLLAWLNSLRLDLSALGLERRVKDISPTVSDIVARHAGPGACD